MTNPFTHPDHPLNKSIRLSVPMPRDMLDRIEADAKANLRTPAMQALFIIQEYYEMTGVKVEKRHNK
tara:strand:+ start:290 stop:490 length:201 start_codon:yes stop_codon:yes gene_type:complete